MISSNIKKAWFAFKLLVGLGLLLLLFGLIYFQWINGGQLQSEEKILTDIAYAIIGLGVGSLVGVILCYVDKQIDN